jgi:uncharacterized Zn-binding protein involved in type VI secretion
MPFPAARVGDTTASGDTITGPGMPTVLIGGMPASVMGDMVQGPTCTTGNIVMGSMTVLIGNKPAARVSSTVVGVNTAGAIPIPVSTSIAVGCPTVMIA